MNISLRQLRAFVELAKTESFTVAAQNLFITQSALSSLIKQMELSLGLQLFDRSTRHVHLSDIGKDLHPLIDKILLDLGSVLDEAANLKALKKGLLITHLKLPLSVLGLGRVLGMLLQLIPFG